MKAAELFDLKGRVALVTGASGGLGLRFAEVLAANGAAVALVARRADRLEGRRARRSRRPAARPIAVEADVLDRAAMNRAFDQAEKALGTVTILVNNAGVAHSTRAIDVTEDEWRHVVRTNLDAVFFWAQEGARRMLAANKKGAIVNIASVLGFGVSKGTIAYATAKAGVIQMTKALGTRTRLQGRARQRHRAGLVRHRHQPRLSVERGRARSSPATFRSAASARTAISTARCCCSRRTPAAYIAGATIVVRRRPDGGAARASRRSPWRETSRARLPCRFCQSRAAPSRLPSRRRTRSTCGDSVARFDQRRPGHSPTRPQPIAEQRRSRPPAAHRSRSRVGQKLVRRQASAARAAARARSPAGDRERRRHHQRQARVPGPEQMSRKSSTLAGCTMPEISSPEPNMKPQPKRAIASHGSAPACRVSATTATARLMKIDGRHDRARRQPRDAADAMAGRAAAAQPRAEADQQSGADDHASSSRGISRRRQRYAGEAAGSAAQRSARR